MFKTFFSIRAAKKIIDEFKPDVVVGTGGYICGPVFSAALSRKIPTVLHESNAYPGKAVKMFAKDVDKDYEKSQRRAARLKRNTPTENKVEEIVDVKVE